MQPSRILAAVLIVFLGGTGPLSAQKLIYLEGKKLNLLKLLPPPRSLALRARKKTSWKCSKFRRTARRRR
jgi:hypothetical protein